MFNINEKSFLVRRKAEIRRKRCYIELLKLLIKEKVKYMKNHDGIFFDVGLLSDDVLTKIDGILKFHEVKKEKHFYNNILKNGHKI